MSHMRTKTKKKTKRKKQQGDLITVILLCDSPGYRMKSYGPISLIPIDSKKLIDIQISAIRSVFPKCEIIFCLGFDCDKVCKYLRSKNISNVRVVENQLYSTTNSCESLRLCLNNTNNNKVLICDGNLLISKSVVSLIDINTSCILVETVANETLEIGVNIHNNFAQFFSFGAKHTWSEILFLEGDRILEAFKKILCNKEHKTHFVFEAVNDLIAMKHQIKTIPHKHSLYKVNNIKTYHNIKDSPK